MSVIDDLKRLERLGDECSETTRKLRAATKNLAEKILVLTKDYPFEYKLAENYQRMKQTFIKDGNVYEMVFLVGPHSDMSADNLDVLNGAVEHDEHLVGYDWGNEYDVVIRKISNDNYTTFARDIANGLLDEICKNVEDYINDSKLNIELIEKATPND